MIALPALFTYAIWRDVAADWLTKLTSPFVRFCSRGDGQDHGGGADARDTYVEIVIELPVVEEVLAGHVVDEAVRPLGKGDRACAAKECEPRYAAETHGGSRKREEGQAEKKRRGDEGKGKAKRKRFKRTRSES
jgi:hypothetical protein